MMEKNVLNTVIYVSSLNSLNSLRYTQKKSTLKTIMFLNMHIALDNNMEMYIFNESY